MVRELKRKKFSKRINEIVNSRFFIPFAILVVVIGTIPVIQLISSGRLDIRQRAAPAKPTATMTVTPSTGSYMVGQQVVAVVTIDGGGQDFNAASSEIVVSSNLSLQNLTIIPPEAGGCSFTFANPKKTPTISNPSFSGTILSGYLKSCSLMTLTFNAESVGESSIQLLRATVKSYTENRDILLSAVGANYTITSFVPTPTFTPTPTPTNTPTPTPTNTPTPTPKTVFR